MTGLQWFMLILGGLILIGQIGVFVFLRSQFIKHRDEGRKSFMEIIQFLDFLTRRFLPIVPDKMGTRHLVIGPEARSTYHAHEMQILQRMASSQYKAWADKKLQEYVTEMAEAARARAAYEQMMEEE